MARIAGAILASTALLGLLWLITGGEMLQSGPGIHYPWYQFWPWYLTVMDLGSFAGGLWLLLRREQ